MKAITRIISGLVMALFVTANASAADNPRVLFKTNKGDFTVELFPDKAPKTVANFLGYVRAKHYDGTIFHRVIASFVAQGGGFDKDYQRQPTQASIAIEADNGLSNERGTIAMARTSDPNSATDQFFFNLKFNGFLNHRSKTQQGWGYTVFGKVISGMNIVGRIARAPTGPGGPFSKDVPVDPVIVEAASVVGE
jgi:cyclophilin family peptidyl-prolyl cis-trans isomerase